MDCALSTAPEPLSRASLLVPFAPLPSRFLLWRCAVSTYGHASAAAIHRRTRPRVIPSLVNQFTESSRQPGHIERFHPHLCVVRFDLGDDLTVKLKPAHDDDGQIGEEWVPANELQEVQTRKSGAVHEEDVKNCGGYTRPPQMIHRLSHVHGE